MQIQAEQLAYWYFRLNGFLNIQNFVVHPDEGNNQRTDVDLLGVRFPYREELLHSSRPMEDDIIFRRVRNKTHLVFAEIKKGQCNLNGPWTSQESANMQRVLRSVGILPRQEVELASAALYKMGIYENQLYRVSLFCLGARENEVITTKYPKIPQINWDHCLEFIYTRFRDYRGKKAGHPTWDEQGKALWECSKPVQSRDLEKFIANVEVTA